MNTDQLKYLIEISKSPSISVASEHLHLSTPALSMSIKRLEEELGYKLLTRTHSGTTLSEDGKNLVKIASDFFNQLEQYNASRSEKIAKAIEGTLRLPINYSGGSISAFADYVCTHETKYPGLNISIEEMPKSSIYSYLRNPEEDIDIGFVFRTKVRGDYIDELHSDFQFSPLIGGNLFFVTSPDSIFSDVKTISLKKVCQFPLGTYAASTQDVAPLFYLLQDYFGLSASISCTNNVHLLTERLRRGNFNALALQFPTDAVPTNYAEGCKIIPLWEDIEIKFGVLQYKYKPLSAKSKLFLNELQEYLHSFN